MRRHITGRCLLLGILFLWSFLAGVGCQTRKNAPPKAVRSLPVKKVVGVCFLGALTEGDPPGIFTNPISGSIVSSGPVSEETVQQLSSVLFEKVAKEKGFEMVSRRQALGTYSAIVTSDENTSMDAVTVFQIMGQTLRADAVLVGYIYRWKDRVGGDFGVESAASVAFDLYMIRPIDSKILWQSKFDKTQQSLSENLLDMGTFVKGGGKWMTAEQLAMIGLNKMVAEMPTAGDKQGK